MNDATVVILAGGQSSRMGTNKALLQFNGMTVIENIVNECKKITDNVLIVTNNFADYQFLQLPMVSDKVTGKGPLAGIQAALDAVETDKNLFVACDMPFVSAEIGNELLKDLDEYDVVIPKIDGQLHPLFAAYSKRCLTAVNQSLNDGELRIRHFLDKVRVKTKTEKDFETNLNTVFFNMNNPEEYDKAMKMAKDHEEGRD